MFETESELAELQRLFDATLVRANEHMLSIVTPNRRLTARQVSAYLTGTRHVAFGTVNSRGEPRVSPLDALFIRGQFHMGTGRGATEIAHLQVNPACSAVHMDGDRVAVTVNGTVEWMPRDHSDHDELIQIWIATYGSEPYLLGDIVFFRIQPASMWAFASNPSEFPSS